MRNITKQYLKTTFIIIVIIVVIIIIAFITDLNVIIRINAIIDDVSLITFGIINMMIVRYKTKLATNTTYNISTIWKNNVDIIVAIFITHLMIIIARNHAIIINNIISIVIVVVITIKIEQIRTNITLTIPIMIIDMI